MNPRRLMVALAGVGLAGVGVASGLAACGSTATVGTRAAATIAQTVPEARPAVVRAPGARVAVLEPRDAQTVGHSFRVRVRVSAFRLARSLAGTGPGGEIQFVLDRGRFDEPGFSENGKLALDQAVNGFYSPSLSTVMGYRGIPAGRHVLEVRLADAGGRSTGVVATVRFRVR